MWILSSNRVDIMHLLSHTLFIYDLCVVSEIVGLTICIVVGDM
jgi:hypothetical protein